MTVNPVAGIVTVTDPKAGGVYPATVKAFDSGGLGYPYLTLTVTNPNCSQGLFTGSTNLSVGTNPRSVAIGILMAMASKIYHR
ncbi:MAG: hypothetical protein IPO07_05400 [Haliscomenobacter sp.]|nr:hypothetical protein [Haliscomenobacter sp.]MBK9488280.1 hypothetical protein [Haliscomenobacter sp.]